MGEFPRRASCLSRRLRHSRLVRPRRRLLERSVKVLLGENDCRRAANPPAAAARRRLELLDPRAAPLERAARTGRDDARSPAPRSLPGYATGWHFQRNCGHPRYGRIYGIGLRVPSRASAQKSPPGSRRSSEPRTPTRPRRGAFAPPSRKKRRECLETGALSFCPLSQRLRPLRVRPRPQRRRSAKTRFV